ncbi:hypothetical protein SDJN03_05551, partial [Cucurbita argyrosperma subsp. sororia]
MNSQVKHLLMLITINQAFQTSIPSSMVEFRPISNARQDPELVQVNQQPLGEPKFTEFSRAINTKVYNFQPQQRTMHQQPMFYRETLIEDEWKSSE